MYLRKVLQQRGAMIIAIALLFTAAPTVFAVTFFGEDFNSLWSTTNPPTGPFGAWTITFTGDTSTNDWHRKDAFVFPWMANSTPYACLFGDQITGDAPDSLISPIIDCSNYYNIVLRCSTYFSPLIGLYQAALLGSIDGGLSWSYVIRNYINQIVPPQLETYSLTWAANEPFVRFLWVFEGDPAGLAQWSLDNVSLTGRAVQDTDIAIQGIRRPRRFELPGTASLRAKFMNVGRDTQVNVVVTCSIIHLPDSSYTHNVTDVIDTILPGDTIVHDFSIAWTADTGKYVSTFWCDAAGDQDRSNDTLRRNVTIGWFDEQGYDDGMSAADSSWLWERYGWGVKFTNSLYLNNSALVGSVKFHFSLPLDTLSNRFRVRICDDDGTGGGPGTPLYESGILTAVPGWNSYDLSLDSIAVWDSSFYVFFIQVEGSPLSPKLSRDAVRDTQVSYWACYDTGYVQDFTTGDWMIRCVLNYQFEMPRPLADDFRTVFIGNPEENVVIRPPNRTFIPMARIENWGDQPQANVSVVCSIIPVPAGVPVYWSTRTVDLNPRIDTILRFDPWAPAFFGLGRITVRTLLQTDMNTSNDAKEETIFVHRSAFTQQDLSSYDYRWIDSDTTNGPAFSWIDTSGWFFREYQGDDQTHSMPLTYFAGFTFRFYDTSYQTIWVSDNGWIRLGPDTGYAPPGYPNNSSIPNPMSPNNTIYAFWDDLIYNSTIGGGIFYKKVGTAPNRKFVVIYQDVRRNNAPNSDPITFEVIFSENGVITLQYQDVFCSDARYNYGRSATVGIEDFNGTTGLQYLYGEGGTGGYYPGNKLNSGTAIKIYPYKKDIAMFRKVAPSKYTLPGPVTPQFRLINFGTTTINELFWTYLRIGAIYYDSVATNVSLQPGDSVALSFTPIDLTVGRYPLVCTTALTDDQVRANNSIAETIYVQTWAQKPDIPLGLRRKKVKDGALAYDPVAKKIYGLKGGNDIEFFRYDIMTETWESLPPLPDSNTQTGRRRKAKTGTAICYGDGYIFAIKGGNNQDFYSFNILTNTWTERCTIPVYVPVPGEVRVLKKPKYGAALTYAPISRRVYLLSGNRSRQFLSYDLTTNIWLVADSIPGFYTRIPGSDYRDRKVKSGGALTCGGDTIYALKGGSSNEFYGFVISQDTWIDLRSVPFGTSNKKVKAGACLAFYQGRVFCLKGGNTSELWIYQPVADSFAWFPGTSIPLGFRHKKVKRGGAFVTTDSLLFAFKGSNTQEFWAYGPEVETLFSMASSSNNGPMEKTTEKKIIFGLWIKPNPALSQMQIRYGVTKPTKIRLEVYNVLGERVKTLVNEEKPIGTYSITWDGKADNGKRVSAGIYITKLTQAEKTKTYKLIIAK